MANPCCCCCCCDFICHLGAVGMHQHCNFLDLEFSSRLFLADWYAHHLTDQLSPVQNICAT
jgi:hypothetical protein